MKTPEISFVIPTRNRPAILQRTLKKLGQLKGFSGEIIVVDNDSKVTFEMPAKVENNWPIKMIRLHDNLAAASRNLGVEQAQSDWICMLDDDSCPLNNRLVHAAKEADNDVAAIAGEILLPSGAHEAGGLPEVFTGCGVLVRRKCFLDAGGYDPSFGFYVEEYDLAARFLLAGWRVSRDPRLLILHEKSGVNRDFASILHRLIRNNGYVIARYAPEEILEEQLQLSLSRYRKIAEKEGVSEAAEAGICELESNLPFQQRRPMSPQLYDRFTGAAAVKKYLPAELERMNIRTVRLISPGKGNEIIRTVLQKETTVDLITTEGISSDAEIIGTLSPGPILDVLASRKKVKNKTIPPWPVTTAWPLT